ncbi:MAG: phosphoribosylanthranilate isomerase [Armatimonadetes bacterium]|nr:phosphoribosylanthranilate isomerase [Armatimonadota bacterium]
MSLLVKVCGLCRPEDVEASVRFGADALGFIFEPMSPRFCTSPTSALSWAEGTPQLKCAVFGSRHADTNVSGFDRIQAFDGLLPQDEAKAFAVIRLSDTDKLDDFLARLANVPSEANAVLLDPYHAHQAGGTGQTLDWGLAAECVRASHLPVILAGGLTPENVGEAIRRVRPAGVDASSRLESEPGKKDHGKIRRFIENARNA